MAQKRSLSFDWYSFDDSSMQHQPEKNEIYWPPRKFKRMESKDQQQATVDLNISSLNDANLIPVTLKKEEEQKEHKLQPKKVKVKKRKRLFTVQKRRRKQIKEDNEELLIKNEKDTQPVLLPMEESFPSLFNKQKEGNVLVLYPDGVVLLESLSMTYLQQPIWNCRCTPTTTFTSYYGGSYGNNSNTFYNGSTFGNYNTSYNGSTFRNYNNSFYNGNTYSHYNNPYNSSANYYSDGYVTYAQQGLSRREIILSTLSVDYCCVEYLHKMECKEEENTCARRFRPANYSIVEKGATGEGIWKGPIVFYKKSRILCSEQDVEYFTNTLREVTQGD